MKKETTLHWIARIDASLIQMLNYIDQDFSFRDLAEGSAYSHYHFHRNFKRLTGETADDCMRRLRLERAVCLLRSTSLRIFDIAIESGYATQESFTKAFTAAMGITPLRLRKLTTWDGKTLSQTGIHYPAGKTKQYWTPALLTTGGMKMIVKIVELEKMNIVSLRNNGDYWKLPQTWQTFTKELEDQQALWPGARFMILFHDHNNDIPMPQKRSDVSMTIPPGFTPKGNLFQQETPGGIYAMYVHVGSYEAIGPAWDAWKRDWLPNSGWEADASRPSLEWYQNSPESTPPELLVTFLCEPVKKK